MLSGLLSSENPKMRSVPLHISSFHTYACQMPHRHQYGDIFSLWYPGTMSPLEGRPCSKGNSSQEGAAMQEDKVPRIMPRVMVEMQPEQHVAMLTVFKTDVIQLLDRECKRNRFDGPCERTCTHAHAHPVIRMSCTSGLCSESCAPAD